jgi:hypothetical protein
MLRLAEKLRVARGEPKQPKQYKAGCNKNQRPPIALNSREGEMGSSGTHIVSWTTTPGDFGQTSKDDQRQQQQCPPALQTFVGRTAFHEFGLARSVSDFVAGIHAGVARLRAEIGGV